MSISGPAGPLNLLAVVVASCTIPAASRMLGVKLSTEQSSRFFILATLTWPFLDKPNDMSGKYQVDLTNLSDKAVKALEDMGISVRNKEGKGFYITAKSNHEIKALDKNGEQVLAHIGNGTKAVCVMGSYSWTFKNKKGVSPSLKKLVITDLVTYSAQPKQDEEETEDVL